jgi:hypothetical protein
MVERARRNHQQRQAVLQRDRRRRADRAIAASYPEDPCLRRGQAQLRHEALARGGLDQHGLGKYRTKPLDQLR